MSERVLSSIQNCQNLIVCCFHQALMRVVGLYDRMYFAYRVLSIFEFSEYVELLWNEMTSNDKKYSAIQMDALVIDLNDIRLLQNHREQYCRSSNTQIKYHRLEAISLLEKAMELLACYIV
ncbi:hypothetical protein BDB01DRAFT_834962 [Pilobolus umbonatus]|nr:hypothetical protein BDB01DRAFT_834962 [Pilobolus umbonatus]